MSEQSIKSITNAINPRTARAVAAILGQTSTDEAIRQMNQSEGRNGSEQASFLAAQSPFLREIYEHGGTVADGILTVPRENLSLTPEIEIATTHTAVERLTKLTDDAEKAKELAPKLVAHGEQIAGSNTDGQTRLKVFGWLYRVLEGKQELLPNDLAQNAEREQTEQSQSSFSEKWEQIVELSEALAALEPKDKLPENSFDEFRENEKNLHYQSEPEENLTESELYENEIEPENAERTEEIISSSGLIGFERIEISSDLPKIPENLGRSDFEKLLEKAANIDLQLENGVPTREILAPFRGYVELTRLDNELRLVEEEHVKILFQKIGKETDENYRFVAGREEMRQLADDKLLLGELRTKQTKITETLQTNFSQNESVEKARQPISKNGSSDPGNHNNSSKQQKIELTADEAELKELLTEEKNLSREIETLSGSINEREIKFRPLHELSNNKLPAQRQKELTEKVLSLELPAGSVLKEKYPESTPQARNEKLSEANTFEIQDPAEYLFVREEAAKHFLILKMREIKNEYRKFEGKNIGEFADKNRARKEFGEHREKIKDLISLEPVFAYKIEGSNRVINAEPSERAVAGYEFVNQYIRYQLKQPETQIRRESVLYRAFAERLESAKTTQDVLRESYKIRQENHRAAGVWKNATKEERGKIERPLSKNEMSLLFLEQAPRSFTTEMSFLKYNFAHYSAAKEKMTAALLEGKPEPSAEAGRLIESLENRLVRRDLETKHKATKHFFESLKTENEKLFIKNEFDHSKAYQNLPPHEKDWIYVRATQQKENLEYNIAYEREKITSAKLQPQGETLAINENSKNLRQEFAAGTLWHQAASLSNRNESKSNERGAGNLDEKTLKAIGYLIHNQSEANNRSVGEWLGKQKSEDLQTAGEILKTFARATREIENNRLTVTIKIAETNRVSTADYKKLFERYFPTDFEKTKEFRMNDNEKFRLEQSRRDGQSAVLGAWKQDAGEAIYQPDAPIKVFENEGRQLQEIESIKAAQVECRRAVEIKNTILQKYEEKLKKEFGKSGQTVSEGDLRTAVERALTPEKSDSLSSEKMFIFQKAQDKISSSDFERFRANTKLIEKGIARINQSFEAVAELRLENSQYKLVPEKTENQVSLQKQYETMQEQAQLKQLTAIAREKFKANNPYEVNGEPAKLIDHISDEEREKARVESHKQARIALEPVQLSEPDQNKAIQSKALEFADALEAAHQASMGKKSESEIEQAFALADAKRQSLDESLKIEKKLSISLENQPVSLKIYERELARNERAIAQAKISRMVETGELSLHDLETKKAGEIFSAEERASMRLEAGERTRETLEPKELWASRRDVSEKLQQAALGASEALERAHEIYHETGAEKKEVAQAFSALDVGIINLKNERRTMQSRTKFINFKTDFKRDLAQMFERGQPSENPHLLAAMTKGLLINSLEKQNLPPEKIGISSENLNEISRTISGTMGDDKNREKTINVNNRFVIPEIRDTSIDESQNHFPRTRKIEHTR